MEGPIIEEAVLTDISEKRASFFIKSINKSMNLKYDEQSGGIEKHRFFKTLMKVVVLLKSYKAMEEEMKNEGYIRYTVVEPLA